MTIETFLAAEFRGAKIERYLRSSDFATMGEVAEAVYRLGRSFGYDGIGFGETSRRELVEFIMPMFPPSKTYKELENDLRALYREERRLKTAMQFAEQWERRGFRLKDRTR